MWFLQASGFAKIVCFILCNVLWLQHSDDMMSAFVCNRKSSLWGSGWVLERIIQENGVLLYDFENNRVLLRKTYPAVCISGDTIDDFIAVAKIIILNVQSQIVSSKQLNFNRMDWKMIRTKIVGQDLVGEIF